MSSSGSDDSDNNAQPQQLKEVESASDLRDFLYDRSAESQFDETERQFWPRGVMDSLDDRDLIMRVLGITNESSQDLLDLVRFIHESARKLFLVTSSTDLSREKLRTSMQKFSEAHFNDSKLPFKSRDSLKQRLKEIDSKLWKSAANINIIYD